MNSKSSNSKLNMTDKEIDAEIKKLEEKEEELKRSN